MKSNKPNQKDLPQTPTENNTAVPQSSNNINNSISNNSNINNNDSYENLNRIIQTGIETAQNFQFNLSQNNLTNITTSSTSNTNTTDTGSASTTGTNASTDGTNAPSNNNSPTTTTTSSTDSCEDIFQNISKTSTLLQDINNIKEQLARLDLDPTQRLYFDNCVNPLLTTLYELSASSSTLASAVNLLFTSPVVHAKTSQLKDTTHLIYRINEKCEDVYKVLKKRIDTMLDIC